MPEYNPFSLEGKIILVTGASSGIGRATAVECSRMGATMIITGRNEQRLDETLGMLSNPEKHSKIIADLSTEEGITTVIEQLPGLDGVVLCAGISNTSPLKFSKREKFDKVFNINFFSQVEQLRMLVKKKLLNRNSSVVVIDSIGGVYVFSSGNMIYGASKAALTSAMKFCAKELAPKVRVNCICPGMVETPLIVADTFSDEDKAADIKRYPMGRYGEPKDIAYCAVYLLSDASSWVTGQNFTIDGGITHYHI